MDRESFDLEDLGWLETRKCTEVALITLMVGGVLALICFSIINTISGGILISKTVGFSVIGATGVSFLIFLFMSRVPWTPLKFDHYHIMRKILPTRGTSDMKRTARAVVAECKKIDSFGEELLKYITEGPGNDGEAEEFRRNVEDKYCSIARRAQTYNKEVKAKNEERRQNFVSCFNFAFF